MNDRRTGTGKGNVLKAAFRRGKTRFVVGYHPLFVCARLVRDPRPINLLQRFCELAGFVTAALRGYQRQVPDDLVVCLRAEQLGRLKQLLLHFHDPAGGESHCR